MSDFNVPNSVDDVIDGLEVFIGSDTPVNVGEVLRQLDHMNLSSADLQRLLAVAQRGFQEGLQQSPRDVSFESIVSYIRGRLSQYTS